MTETTAYTAASAAPSKPVHTTSGSISEVTKGYPLRDQYGQTDSTKLDEGSVVTFTFYGDCPRCTLSTRAIAALQQEFIQRGLKVKIVGINVKPESELTDKDLTIGFYERGVRQFSGENLESLTKAGVDGNTSRDAAYIQGQAIPAKDRLFHILRPKDSADAQGIQRRMGHATVGTEEHTAVISLYHNGKFVEHYQGLPKIKERKDGKEIWREIKTTDFDDGDLKDPKSITSQVSDYAKAQLAPAISGRVEELNKQPQVTSPAAAPNPDALTNKGLWNFGIPAIVMLVSALWSGKFSLKSLLVGGGLAAAASVLTQWVTGAGFFAEKADATTHTPSNTPSGTEHDEKSDSKVSLEKANQQYSERAPVKDAYVSDNPVPPVVPKKIPSPIDKNAGLSYG